MNFPLTQHSNDIPLCSSLSPSTVAVIQSVWQVVPFHSSRQQSGSSQFDRDQDVKDGDNRHGDDEEQHRGYLECVIDQYTLHGASCAIQNDRAIVVFINDTELNRLWHGKAQCQ